MAATVKQAPSAKAKGLGAKVAQAVKNGNDAPKNAEGGEVKEKAARVRKLAYTPPPTALVKAARPKAQELVKASDALAASVKNALAVVHNADEASLAAMDNATKRFGTMAFRVQLEIRHEIVKRYMAKAKDGKESKDWAWKKAAELLGVSVVTLSRDVSIVDRILHPTAKFGDGGVPQEEVEAAIANLGDKQFLTIAKSCTNPRSALVAFHRNKVANPLYNTVNAYEDAKGMKEGVTPRGDRSREGKPVEDLDKFLACVETARGLLSNKTEHQYIYHSGDWKVSDTEPEGGAWAELSYNGGNRMLEFKGDTEGYLDSKDDDDEEDEEETEPEEDEEESEGEDDEEEGEEDDDEEETDDDAEEGEEDDDSESEDDDEEDDDELS